VLLGKQCGWDKNSDLLVIVGCNESGSHGDLRLAESNISADQAIHHFLSAHIRFDRLDCSGLIRRFFKTETGAKLIPCCVIEFVRISDARLSLCIYLK
jgi:hypothetical protein